LVALVVSSVASYGQQQYPNKSIHVIVPYAAGGAADAVARVVSQSLSAQVGVPVVVENRAGAGGIIGSDLVAKAEPDGYTLLVTSLSHTINPSLKKNLPFDTQRDFAPVVLMADAPNLLVVHPSVPVKTVAELIEYARANPGKLTYASAGSGTGTHLAAELFKVMTKTDLLHVPYKGGGPAAADLLGGQVQVAFATMATVLENARSGRLRGLAVTSSQRFAGAPEFPTIAEGGVPGYELSAWTGMFAPAKTPKQVIDRLAQEVAKSLHDATVKERLLTQGAQAAVKMPDEFAALVASEIRKWKRVAEFSGLRAE
jgi:tripartite-type tricarboxylate transporter receptor subunit TctC